MMLYVNEGKFRGSAYPFLLSSLLLALTTPVVINPLLLQEDAMKAKLETLKKKFDSIPRKETTTEFRFLQVSYMFPHSRGLSVYS